jgi:hypothetical protein
MQLGEFFLEALQFCTQGRRAVFSKLILARTILLNPLKQRFLSSQFGGCRLNLDLHLIQEDKVIGYALIALGQLKLQLGDQGF